MLKHKKKALKEEIIPNFTGYPYSEVIREFAECDRIPESELKRLECHKKYYLEWNLNSFNDAELNDHLYRIYYPKRMDTQVLHRYIAYYVNLYPKQITQKASSYLDSKKLMLNEWLKSVKEGRRGDIFCVYLLSMATGSHTAVHMRNNKVWSTLKDMPTSHDELIQQCDKHLVYLGLLVFLQLKVRVTVDILGTITGQDPKTHKLLVASVTQLIKHEEQEDSEVHVLPKKHATPAAGSAAQLDHVEKEMRTSAEIIGTTSTSVIPTTGKEMGPSITGKPMVNMLPFEVWLVRLTPQEILKYTQKYPPSEKLHSEPGRSSPVKTRSMRFRLLSTQGKKRIISGRPTQRIVSMTSVSIHRHILHRRKLKLRLKCRIKRCTLAYVSFNTFKDLNAHHHIYHPSILFKCPSCGKSFATPSTWKNHKYGCTHQKLYKYKSCRKRFLFNSTLRQHNRSHTCQKLFKCFYGKCMN